MGRPRDEDRLEKVTHNVRWGDFFILQELHGDIGAGKRVRLLVKDYIDDLFTKSARQRILERRNHAPR